MKVDLDTMKSTTCSDEEKGKMCLFSDKAKLAIAQNMERIEEGIIKGRNSLKISRVISNEWSAERPEVH